MSRRSHRVPDWPKSLALVPAPAQEQPPAPTEETPARPVAAPILAVALGTLRDGRHAALEVEVAGRTALQATLLYAAPEVATVARRFHETAFQRLYQRQEYSAHERAEHTPLELEALREATAVALPAWRGKPAALAFEVEGRTVTEPRVIATGDRLFAWDSLESWIAVNLLPRRK